MERSSLNYAGTYFHKTPEGAKKIADLREMVKQKYDGMKRVVLMGRLGDAPEMVRANYRNKWNGKGHQYIRIGDAGHVDAYILQK